MTPEKIKIVEQRHEVIQGVVDILSTLRKEASDGEASFLLLTDIVMQKVDELLASPEISGTELQTRLQEKLHMLQELVSAETIDYAQLVARVDEILSQPVVVQETSQTPTVQQPTSSEQTRPTVLGGTTEAALSVDVPSAPLAVEQIVERRSYDTVSLLFPDRRIVVEGVSYAIKERIGSGATKHVYKAETESGEACAVACITLPVFSGSTRREREMILQSIASEVSISHQLTNIPEVLMYYGARYFDRSGVEMAISGELSLEEIKGVHHIVLTSELVSGSNLSDTAKAEKKSVLGSYETLIDLSIAEVQKGFENFQKTPAFLNRVQREIDEMRRRGDDMPEDELRAQVVRGLLTDQIFEQKKREREVRNFDKLKQGATQVLSASVAAARGLDAMHQAGFVHQDVKPDNLFPTSVIDLGSAAKEYELMQDFHGTPHYMDPGLINNRAIAAENVFYHRAQDLRAFAQSLIEIACTMLDLPEFVAQPPERSKSGDIIHGSAFLQSFRSFDEVRDRYAFLADVYRSGLRLPDVVTDALSVSDAEVVKQQRTMSCVDLVTAVVSWVDTLTYDQSQSVRRKLEKLASPETYTNENQDYVTWMRYRKSEQVA